MIYKDKKYTAEELYNNFKFDGCVRLVTFKSRCSGLAKTEINDEWIERELQPKAKSKNAGIEVLIINTAKLWPAPSC